MICLKFSSEIFDLEGRFNFLNPSGLSIEKTIHPTGYFETSILMLKTFLYFDFSSVLEKFFHSKFLQALMDNPSFFACPTEARMTLDASGPRHRNGKFSD